AASMPECPLPVSFCPPSFFNRYGDPRHLPSFPTRRSSDLGRGIVYLHSEESEVSARRVFAASHATHAVADRPGVHASAQVGADRSEEHTSELQSRVDLVCRLLLEKKKIHMEEEV